MKLTFPNEEHVTKHLGQQFAGHFDYAQRLLRFWIEEDLDTGFNSSSLPPIVLRVLLAMHVKACRQFRSVIELCECGDAADGSIIARSMFETELVVRFVLKPRFIPREYRKDGKVKKIISVPGTKLTREFRATLFVTHQLLQQERFSKRIEFRPGMKRIAKRMATLVDKDEIIHSFKKEIGPEWTKLLADYPYTYSCLNTGNLARSLGLSSSKWHAVVYPQQSEHVHPGDSLYYMQIDEDKVTSPIWHDTPKDIVRVLRAAIDIFLRITSVMNKHVKFGRKVNEAIDAFYREYVQLPGLE